MRLRNDILFVEWKAGLVIFRSHYKVLEWYMLQIFIVARELCGNHNARLHTSIILLLMTLVDEISPNNSKKVNFGKFTSESHLQHIAIDVKIEWLRIALETQVVQTMSLVSLKLSTQRLVALEVAHVSVARSTLLVNRQHQIERAVGLLSYSDRGNTCILIL